MSAKKILIITTEPLPYKGFATTGAGLRAWGIGKGLEHKGFEVSIAFPKRILSRQDTESINNDELVNEIAENTFEPNKLDDFIADKSPDIVIFQHWGLMKYVLHLNIPLVLDLAGPHLLERYYWGEKNYEAIFNEKINALKKADLITCSGEFQKHYFLPFLQIAGYDIEEFPFPVILFSMSPEIPEHHYPDQITFVYSGLFLPWQDPTVTINTLLKELDNKNKGKLLFFGGIHPDGDVSQGKFSTVLDSIKKHNKVNYNGIVPYDKLIDSLKNSSIAVDLMKRNYERELAFTSRTVVNLWCGLPVIYNNYSELSHLISEYDAGWILDPNDTDSTQHTISEIIENPEIIKMKGKNAQALVLDRMDWNKTIEPIAEFCNTPYIREKDIIAIKSFSNIERIKNLESELDKTKSELLTLKGKLIFRLYKKFGKISFIFAPFIFLILIIVSIIMFIFYFIFHRKKD